MKKKVLEKDRVIQVRIEGELIDKLDAICEDEGRVRSKVIRKLIADYLASRED